MQGFKNILVVAGENAVKTRTLLKPAIELAAPASGVVTLLDLNSRSTRRSISRRRASAVFPSPLHRLYDPGPNLRKLGVPVHHETARGVPYLEILERIATYGHDLVVVGSDADLGRIAFPGRSTATRVLRASQVPVLLYPEGGETAGPIAVAVGPRDVDDPADLLNKKLVDIGAALARSFKRDLHIIHAWRLDGETMMRSPRLDFETSDIERMARESQFEARMRAEELLADAGVADLNVTVHVDKGHAGDVISSRTDGLNPGFLVVGTVARQGLQGAVVGNTVERVARRSPSPVLAVKPDGFFAPRIAIEDWTPQALPY